MKSGKKGPMTGYTGKIGNTGMYQRMVNGREIMQRCPTFKKYNDHREWPEQVKKLHYATKYASAILQNPEVKALYEKVAGGFNSANSMAVKDYLMPAVIAKVVTTGYIGRTGYSMAIRINNIVPVVSVIVTIENPQGETIESGPAAIQPSGCDWQYTTTRSNLQYKGSLLRIVSRDLPGHNVEWTKVF